MSDVTLLIARLRKGVWERRWPEELLITAARTLQEIVDENNRLRELNKARTVDQARIKELETENKRMKEQAREFIWGEDNPELLEQKR